MSINIYTNIVENIYYKLCDISIIGNQKTEIQPMCNNLKFFLTLSAYITGLINPLKALVKVKLKYTS